MNEVLARWNRLPAAEAEDEILPCCGSRVWARGMVARRPIADEAELLIVADEAWRVLSEADWTEAFHSHPRIGESRDEKHSARRSGAWSAQEQSGVATGGNTVRVALAEANREYEKRFGRIFIVCATDKSASEILQILRRRLYNDPLTELGEAAEQQRQITHIRLKRWLMP